MHTTQEARPLFAAAVGTVVTMYLSVALNITVLVLGSLKARQRSRMRNQPVAERQSGDDFRLIILSRPEFLDWLGGCQVLAGTVPSLILFILFCRGENFLAPVANFGIYLSLSGEVSRADERTDGVLTNSFSVCFGFANGPKRGPTSRCSPRSPLAP